MTDKTSKASEGAADEQRDPLVIASRHLENISQRMMEIDHAPINKEQVYGAIATALLFLMQRQIAMQDSKKSPACGSVSLDAIIDRLTAQKLRANKIPAADGDYNVVELPEHMRLTQYVSHEPEPEPEKQAEKPDAPAAAVSEPRHMQQNGPHIFRLDSNPLDFAAGVVICFGLSATTHVFEITELQGLALQAIFAAIAIAAARPIERRLVKAKTDALLAEHVPAEPAEEHHDAGGVQRQTKN